ncbi:MAG: hypothetical protein ACN4GG_12225 [Akkermansiaceae bacterium]
MERSLIWLLQDGPRHEENVVTIVVLEGKVWSLGCWKAMPFGVCHWILGFPMMGPVPIDTTIKTLALARAVKKHGKEEHPVSGWVLLS